MIKKIKSFLGLTRSRGGSNMLLLFLGIALVLYAIFHKKVASKISQKLAPSPSQAISAIETILVQNGYSSRMASYWVAVSDFETGYWTSNLYLNNFNLFGMKNPRIRATKSVAPKGSTWAKFDSIQESVLDLVLYMHEFNYPGDFNSLGEMVKFMKSVGYFEEPYEVYFKGVSSRV